MQSKDDKDLRQQNAGILGSLPTDLQNEMVFYLNRYALSSLQSTCRFFAAQEGIRISKESKPLFEIITRKNHTLLLVNNRWLLVAGKNPGLLPKPDNKEAHINCFKLWALSFLEAGKYIAQLVSTDEYILLLTSEGKLWVAGNNHLGQLGLSATIKRQDGFIECSISELQPEECIKKIVSEYNRTILVTSKGRVLVAGNNCSGQLGLPHAEKAVYGFKVCTISGLQEDESISEITIARVHTLLLTNRGTLLGSGDNRFGQMGFTGEKVIIYGFKVCIISSLITDERIKKIIGGDRHTLLFTNKGRFLGSGSNTYAELGFSSKTIPNLFDFTTNSPQNLETGERIQQVATAGKHTLLLTSNQKLWGTGTNLGGELGFPKEKGYLKGFELCVINCLGEEEHIKKIVTKTGHSILLTNKGNIYVSGSNHGGKLGLPQAEKYVYGFKICPINCLEKDEFISQIIAEAQHTLLRTNKNRLLGSGDNSNGQLGLLEPQVFGFAVCDIQWRNNRGEHAHNPENEEAADTTNVPLF